MKSNIEELVANDVFAEDVQYLVPMYQRSFAWEDADVKLLLQDINGIDLNSKQRDSDYYLGMLVVDKDKKQQNYFEVIDGQQRLTSLYLLAYYLNKRKGDVERLNFMKERLQYEARSKYKDALCDPEKAEVTEISGRYGTIKEFLDEFTNEDLDKFCEKLKKVFLLRVQVPEDVDLNHYFEIMNTRGEQLEPHQIAKARILAKIRDVETVIKETNLDEEAAKKVAEDNTKLAAMIWEACSDMDSYVQMNFKKRIRTKIFGEAWDSDVLTKNWDDLVGALVKAEEEEEKERAKSDKTGETGELNDGEQKTGEQTADKQKNNKQEEVLTKSLRDFLREEPDSPKEQAKKNEDEEKTRFESILSFPNFLLQVRALDSYKESESPSESTDLSAANPNEDEDSDDAGDEDPSLDDKKFLNLLEGIWKADTAKPARDFLVGLLKRRFLFDKYILKREFTKKVKSTGQWSLRRLERYLKGERDKNGNIRKKESENYVNTFGDDDTKDDKNTKKLRDLQSALRITYTSSKSMRWITKVLKYLDDYNNLDKPAELTRYLEEYCLYKIKESDYKNKSGFAIKHIVFSYLDYLLLYSKEYGALADKMKGTDDSGNAKAWEFQFRPSIEHFFPRNPRNDDRWDKEEKDEVTRKALNCFGNLALVSDSGNSELSNDYPSEKIKPKHLYVINQSIKLKIMAKITADNGDKWDPKDAIAHGDEMMRILDKEYPDN